MKLVFLHGTKLMPKKKFDFGNLFDSPEGLTGSEMSCLRYAEALSIRGHDVILGCPAVSSGNWRDVQIAPLGEIQFDDVDAVLSWNEPDLLRGISSRVLRIVNQQVNDFSYVDKDWDKWVDIYTSPSQSHLEHLSVQTPSPYKWVVLPNGCDARTISATKVNNQLVYASSPDRGLHQLLEMWPRIKRRVPGAKLKIFYSLKMFLAAANRLPVDAHPVIPRAIKVRDWLEAYKDLNIEVIGQVSTNRMRHELETAHALVYPCDPYTYTEGFSVTVMDACAAGTVPVITDADALGEVYGGVVHMAHRREIGEIDQDGFIDILVSTLTSPEVYIAAQTRGFKLAAQHDWAVLGRRLESLLEKGVASKARTPRRQAITNAKPRLYLYNQSHYENWDYRTPDTTGIGGSETAQVEMAKRMAARGYEVVSFAPLADDCNKDWKGTTWLPLHAVDDYLTADGIWIVSRSPEFLDNLPRRAGRKVWFVAQDTQYGPRLTDYRISRIDRVLALCPTHLASLLEVYPAMLGKLYLSGNGVNVERIAEVETATYTRNPRRIVWLSSPDRGIKECLDIFERAREQVWNTEVTPHVQDLELRIFYGMDNIEKACAGDHSKHPWKATWQQYERAQNMPGVTWLGRINQTELARELLQAGIWLYPSWFSETSCIACMEAQCCGAVPIANPIWGVAHNVQHGIFIPGAPSDSLVKARYVQAVINLATCEDVQNSIREKMLPESRERCSWEKIADQYEAWLPQPAELIV